MRVSRVAMSQIYAIYAKLTPNDAESCAERKQSHILMNLTLMDSFSSRSFFMPKNESQTTLFSRFLYNIGKGEDMI
jgi:hypothetical protein